MTRACWLPAQAANMRRRLCGTLVDAIDSHIAKLLVGRLLFVEILLENRSAIFAAELLGPCDQRTVARDLVVLDSLGGGDQSRIQHSLVVDFAGHVAGLLKNAVDRRAIYAFCLDAMHLEDLFET